MPARSFRATVPTAHLARERQYPVCIRECGALTEARKTATPSGKLCTAMPSAVTSPLSSTCIHSIQSALPWVVSAGDKRMRARARGLPLCCWRAAASAKSGPLLPAAGAGAGCPPCPRPCAPCRSPPASWRSRCPPAGDISAGSFRQLLTFTAMSRSAPHCTGDYQLLTGPAAAVAAAAAAPSASAPGANMKVGSGTAATTPAKKSAPQ